MGSWRGRSLQVLFLLPGLSGQGLRLAPALDLANAGLREIGRLLVPNGLSVGVNYGGFIVDTAFGSRSTRSRRPAGAVQRLDAGGAADRADRAGDRAGSLSHGWRIKRPRCIGGRCARRCCARWEPRWGWLSWRCWPYCCWGGRSSAFCSSAGKFDAAAGDLTFQVLGIYALALPFYVATELVTRGLIALRDTRTPLFTNLLQLGGRILLMTLLFDRMDVLAVPAAFAISASLETLLLSTVLWFQLRRREMKVPAA